MSALGPCKRKFIGKYSFYPSNTLGQGYSGVVCQGKNQQTGKACALKIIQKSILKHQAHKSMILCEIEFLTLLKGSQNILTLYDVYNTKNNLYLVVQLCNSDLKDYITAKRRIPQQEAIEIMQKILQGYKSIWKEKIVHRDLKPSNILLHSEQIKIADFGFSMFEKDKNQFEKINIGSPYYMPLEVLAYNTYSFQSDIWALGVIFYQMIVGKIPWKAKTEKQLYQQLKNLDIDKILPKKISQKSKDFLKKTLQIDPKKRIKPQQIVQYSFIDKINPKKDVIGASTRSLKSIELQQQLKKSKIFNRISTEKNLPSLQPPQNERKYSQKIGDIPRKKLFEEQAQLEIIPMPVTEQSDILGCQRMKAQNEAEKLDEVDELPKPSKKRKTFVHRKISFGAQCQNSQHFPSNKSIDERLEKNDTNQEQRQKNHTISESFKEFSKKDKCLPTQTSLKLVSQKELTQKSAKNQEIMKKFSLQLRSQIHFCRYIFKLLTKMLQTFPKESKLVRQQLKEQMAALIFFKLKEVQQSKIAQSEIHQQWLKTKQYQKIRLIVKQYKTRYFIALKGFKATKQYHADTFNKQIRKSILYLFKLAFEALLAEQQQQQRETKKRPKKDALTSIMQADQASQIMKIKDEIVILDQLITLKQLHKLNERYGWQAFLAKSKIQSIVEGEPLNYIQKKHILAISSKLTTLKIL